MSGLSERRVAREHPDIVAAKVRAENSVWHGKVE